LKPAFARGLEVGLRGIFESPVSAHQRISSGNQMGVMFVMRNRKPLKRKGLRGGAREKSERWEGD